MSKNLLTQWSSHHHNQGLMHQCQGKLTLNLKYEVLVILVGVNQATALGRVAVGETQVRVQEMTRMKVVVEEVMKGVQMGLAMMTKIQMKVNIEIDNVE